jgi:NAD(P)-dependent dehydrogenase (short-subunit alcohol dehydrogenase family)
MLVVDDLNWHTRQYSRWRGYADSKLAVMAFVAELARRGARVYVSDPGATNTEITRATPPLMRWLGNRKHQITHSAAVGAVSTLQAVVTDLPSGSYIAPRLAGLYGRPRATTLRHKAVDPLVGRRLWERSVELTGCDWPG